MHQKIPDHQDFQATINGLSADLFVLQGDNMSVALTNYGARVIGLWVPDKEGQYDNIVAGYDTIADYQNHNELYLGATVGRYANRIGGAAFELNGQEYCLQANEGENQLHGGDEGFHNRVWEVIDYREDRLEMRYVSPHGAGGYPGTLKIDVDFRVENKTLSISYTAESDSDTVINVTNHTYFNLGGTSNKVNAREHLLKLYANGYTPVDSDQIPTGTIEPVDGTPFDFRTFRSIGTYAEDNHPQLIIGSGYDHNFVLDKALGEFSLAAEVTDSQTGRKLLVSTTEPGLQFYECKFDKTMNLPVHTAFCLETQHFPDSPNIPGFPSTKLSAGDTFTSQTDYSFAIKN